MRTNLHEDEQLTQRIAIRITATELAELERFAKLEGDRKVSAFVRRVLTLYLRKKKAIAMDVIASSTESISDQLGKIDPGKDRGKYSPDSLGSSAPDSR